MAHDLTTAEVGRLTGVSCRTAARWIDEGRLHGYRLPGSDHRRVQPAELLAFVRRENLPLDLLANDLHGRAAGVSPPV